jgi:hypothetical protein
MPMEMRRNAPDGGMIMASTFMGLASVPSIRGSSGRRCRRRPTTVSRCAIHHRCRQLTVTLEDFAHAAFAGRRPRNFGQRIRRANGMLAHSLAAT